MKPILAFDKNALPYLCSFFSLFIIPVITTAQTVDFGKTYYNLSKAATGGTIEQGDILEIRSMIAIKAGTFDSCSYYDFIPSGATYVPGTIRILTNEGKVYKQFTDAANDDCGWLVGSAIRVNLGFTGDNPATWYRRGRLASTHKPTLYGSTCIMIVSYQIRINAAFDLNINIGGGWFTYQNGTDPVHTYLFPPNSMRVYANTGLCSNIAGANRLGTEYDGTFGGGKARNRVASATVCAPFLRQPLDIGTPYDNGYAIVNNTSTRSNYTTSNAWPKPDNSFPSHRVFSTWDIIGDHTGAEFPEAGNPAADTVASNTGGYMLVVNGAYRSDSIFRRTISGLCPDTYYEISAWFRNLCSKCGCDSNGTGATSIAGPPYYIPTAFGDSSGVHPNISFEIDGIDYYSTGNIPYTGQWVQKGFSFLTGPGQTSFTLKFMNNAPGGGGNDWAVDDISIRSCSPQMAYAPSANPTVCFGNPIVLYDTIRSAMPGYAYYSWQRSTDGGATWVGVTSAEGPELMMYNGSSWEYIASYTVPPAFTQLSDSADQYRLVLAGNADNLGNASCSFTDPERIITLNIIDCGFPLESNLLKFEGHLENNMAQLSWSMAAETRDLVYHLERSTDGRHFGTIAQTPAREFSGETNTYRYADPLRQGDRYYYRIRIAGKDGQSLYSRTILIAAGDAGHIKLRVVNPFSSSLQLELQVEKAGRLQAELVDASGRTVTRTIHTLQAGNNPLRIEPVSQLSSGIYFLRLYVHGEVLQETVYKGRF